jgi:hypothetical protein
MAELLAGPSNFSMLVEMSQLETSQQLCKIRKTKNIIERRIKVLTVTGGYGYLISNKMPPEPGGIQAKRVTPPTKRALLWVANCGLQKNNESSGRIGWLDNHLIYHVV